MRVCVWEETMFLPARCTVAAAVFLSASAASAVEDATLKADLPAVSMLPACKAFIADDSPRDIYLLFEAGRCIGLIQGLAYAPRLVGVCLRHLNRLRPSTLTEWAAAAAPHTWAGLQLVRGVKLD